MRFLVCSLASHGFLYPAIRIAQALRGPAHVVAFVTGSAFGDTLQPAPEHGLVFQVRRSDPRRGEPEKQGLRRFVWVIFANFDHPTVAPSQTHETCRRVKVKEQG